MISSTDLTSRASSIDLLRRRGPSTPSASSAASIGGSTMSTPIGMSATPSARRISAISLAAPREQPGIRRDGAAQADHPAADVLGQQPRAVQPMVLGGRAEVPDVRLAAPGQEREAGHLVARPLADVGARDVPDVVEVEQQDGAERRRRPSACRRPREPVRPQPVDVPRAPPSRRSSSRARRRRSVIAVPQCCPVVGGVTGVGTVHSMLHIIPSKQVQRRATPDRRSCAVQSGQASSPGAVALNRGPSLRAARCTTSDTSIGRSPDGPRNPRDVLWALPAPDRGAGPGRRPHRPRRRGARRRGLACAARPLVRGGALRPRGRAADANSARRSIDLRPATSRSCRPGSVTPWGTQAASPPASCRSTRPSACDPRADRRDTFFEPPHDLAAMAAAATRPPFGDPTLRLVGHYDGTPPQLEALRVTDDPPWPRPAGMDIAAARLQRDLGEDAGRPRRSAPIT